MYVAFAFGNATAISKRHSDGSADLSYGKNGYSSPVYLKHCTGIATQSDGKIVAGFDFEGLVRFNINGSLDSSFNEDGISSVNIAIVAVAIQGDGKIVVAGNTGQKVAIARCNSDGSLDSAFGEDGRQTTAFLVKKNYHSSARSLAIQSTGKIVVAGALARNVGGYIHNDFALARYNADGNIDSTFDEDGIQTTDFNTKNDLVSSVAIQNDGKIVVGGSTKLGYLELGFPDFALVRYTIHGSLDSSFSKMENKRQT
jgi:uncharacterized delta-60 repeat protein